jgi:Fibronectin type III domain
MIRTFRSRLAAVSTGVLLAAATLGSLAPTAQAETVSGQVPATITASPTSGLVSGSTVTVSATADTNWNIYSLRGRLCKSDAVIDNAGDFSPTLGGNCIASALVAGTDSDVTVNTEPGARGSATLNFKVGAGSNTFTTQYDGSKTIACGVTSTTGCKLVVEMSANNLNGRVIYKSFPLTYALPNAPTAVSAAWGNAKASVSWTASAAQTGLPAIDTYTVTSTPGSLTCTTSGTSCDVTGLTNGTAYTFAVTATNALGTSVASSASAAVTPSSAAYQISSTPTTGLTSGTTVAQTVSMASNVNLYSVRTRLCKASATINNAGDFSPTLGGNCIGSALVAGTDSDVTVTTSAGNRGSASLNFKVGAGTNTFTTQYDGSKTISCGISTDTRSTCMLETEISYTTALGVGRVVYESTPLTYNSVPAAPTSLNATPGNGSASISFTAGSDGGSAITKYQFSTNGGSTWSDAAAGTTSPVTINGLAKGQSYTINLRAVSTVGNGTASASVNVAIPSTKPAAPVAPIVVVAATGGAATASWTAPDNGGSAITGYIVTATGGATPIVKTITNPATLSQAFTGLSKTTTYTFTVKAVNAVGTSDASAGTSKLPIAVPAKPATITVDSTGNGSVKVNYTAPTADGGSAVTGYLVEAWAPSALSATSTCESNAATLTCTVTGLTNGVMYEMRVFAKNLAGTGTSYNKVKNATPAAAPNAPTGILASQTSGTAAVKVQWTASVTNGSPVTGYTVTVFQGGTLVSGKGCTATGTNCYVSGLSKNTSYTFKVTATNVKGDSPAGVSGSYTTKP